MYAVKLSGAWLWPPEHEVKALIDAACVDNPVETVIRLRALAELAESLDTRTLAELAGIDPADAPALHALSDPARVKAPER